MIIFEYLATERKHSFSKETQTAVTVITAVNGQIKVKINLPNAG